MQTIKTALPESHYSYLYIYISQTIKLYQGDFEDQFQTVLQVKDINF